MPAQRRAPGSSSTTAPTVDHAFLLNALGDATVRSPTAATTRSTISRSSSSSSTVSTVLDVIHQRWAPVGQGRKADSGPLWTKPDLGMSSGLLGDAGQQRAGTVGCREGRTARTNSPRPLASSAIPHHTG